MDVEPNTDLLRESAETHHHVYRIVTGDDPDYTATQPAQPRGQVYARRLKEHFAQ